MSELRSETARINGAKSNGPLTPEGKATSAHNSLRHGLRAKAIVLPGESEEDYKALHAAHVERFQPADQVEMELVEAMAVARWRLRRIANIETHVLTNQMTWNSKHNSSYRELQDDDQRLAYVYEQCSGHINLLSRYESSLNRTFDRALKQLQLLQKSRPSPAPGFVRQSFEPDTLPSPQSSPSTGGAALPPAPRAHPQPQLPPETSPAGPPRGAL